MWEKIGFVEGSGTITLPKEYYFVDLNPKLGKIYYRLRQIDFDGTSKTYDPVEVTFEGDLKYQLEQNYPNPFNPSTKISWQSPIGSWQTLKVYDVLGNEVVTLVNEFREAGQYTVEFNTDELKNKIGSGIYFYTLKTGSYVQTRKMQLLK